jgi:hypothetical protein
MRFGGIVLAALLLLGACSSDPQPKEPKRSATTSDPTPTATVPTMPAQAEEDSPEGAAAFVKHYIDVFNYAASTGDVDELSRLSSPDCEGCQSYIKLYKDTYEAGGYFKGGTWRLSNLELEESPQDRRVFAHLHAAAGTQVAMAGEDPGPTSEENSELVFVVDRGPSDAKLLSLSRSSQ